MWYRHEVGNMFVEYQLLCPGSEQGRKRDGTIISCKEVFEFLVEGRAKCIDPYPPWMFRFAWILHVVLR